MVLTPLSPELGFAVQQAVVGRGHDTLAPYSFVLRLLYGVWLWLPIEHPPLSAFWNTYSFHSSLGAYLLVFLVKLPLLLLDGAVGVALYLALKKTALDRATLGLLAWFANPYVLLINEMWAPVDLLPTFLMFLALLLITRSRFASNASMAAAIALKLFPIVSVPALLVANRGRRKWITGSIMASFVGTIAYFGWLSYAGYDPTLQLSANQHIYAQYFDLDVALSTLEKNLGISALGWGQDTIWLSVVLVVIVAVFMFERWPSEQTFAMDGALVLLLVLLAVSNWWPQYVLWILPLATMDYALRGRRIKYLASISAFAFFLALARFPMYFSSNSNAFVFVSADTDFLRAAAAAYVQFFSSDVVRILLAAVLQVLFTATCLAYAGRIVEDRTLIFSSVFGHVDIVGSLKSTVRRAVQRQRRRFFQWHIEKRTHQPSIADNSERAT
jgi:hypothetical protein